MNSHLKLITNHKRIVSLYDEGHIFCAFDTETTGVNPSSERIIEIGAVKFTKDGIIDFFSTLINPKRDLTPYISNLTGITNKMLTGQPYAEEVIPAFRKFSQDTILVAHNAQFDLRFVNAESERLELFPLANSAVDTLRMSRLLLPDNTSWKQTSLADQFNIDKGQAHRAFDDAKVCASLFQLFVKMPVPKKKKRTRTVTTVSPESSVTKSLALQALL